MFPDQPTPPPSYQGPQLTPPVNHDPYGFITDPQKASKAPLLGGNSFFKQIALILGGFVLLLIVLGIILSVALPSSNSTTDLTKIAQSQQELIRISTVGAQQSSSQFAKNLSITSRLSLLTNQGQLLTYMAGTGVKLAPKTLALSRNAQTDQTLAAAQATSTFDIALEQIMISQLQTYQNSLRQEFSKTKNKTLKIVILKNYQSAVLLLEQAQAAQAQATNS